MAQRGFVGGLAGLALGLLAGAAQADPIAPEGEARFEVTLRGLSVGLLRVVTARSDGAYAATARVEPAGLARVLPSARFEATVQGQVRSGRAQPLRYAEDVNTGRRESRTEMVWDRGVPRVLRSEPARPPEPWHIDAADQAGTVDPMTLLLSLLAEVPPAQACRMDLATFDGRRRGRMVLAPGPQAGEQVTCTGIFRRVAGYAPEDLAERPEFPFSVTYAPGPGGALRVVAMEADGQLGTTRLTRN